MTGFSPLPTFDARDGSTYSIYQRQFQYLTNAGTLANAEVDGIHPKVTSIGGQFHYEAGDAITIDDSLRYTDMSGNFTTQFMNVAPTASLIGSSARGVNANAAAGAVVGAIRYASGPLAGQAYTGTYVNTNPNINTVMRDMGSFANNLTLSGKFDLGAGRVRATAGWFHMRQTIVQDWHVNRQYSELNGENAATLDLFTTTGTQLTANGQAGFNNGFGTCCARTVDLRYTDDAPFASVNYSLAGLELDASVRYDSMKGEGTAQVSATGPNVAVTDALGSATLPSLLPRALPIERIDYRKGYTSWSVGALYAFNGATSVFGRVSRGGRFNADRRTLSGSVSAAGVYTGGNFNADGSLNAQGQSSAINYLNQQEIGLKQRGDIGAGTYSVEVTGFRSTLTENNFDFTRVNNPAPNNDPNISNGYRSHGVEFTGRFNLSNFRLAVDATYIQSKIVSSATAALVGNRPGGQPKFIVLVSPSYDAGVIAGGLSFSGQTSTPLDDFNTYTVKGTTFVNGFVKVRPTPNIELGLNANNIFDTLGYRGGGSLVPVAGQTAIGSTAIFQNSAVYGRTVTGSIRYRF